MRGRLIALLRQRSCIYMPCDGDCGDCKNIEMFDEGIEQIADHLLANDVTIRERGEWEQYGLRNPKCTLCHGYNTEKSNFCPHCGADMRGSDMK